MEDLGQHRSARTTARVVVALLVAASLSGVAQTSASGAEPPRTGPRLLDRQEETGKVGFIGTRAGRPIDSGFDAGAAPAKVARSFLADRAGSLGLRGSGLGVVETHRTPGGGVAVRMQQSFDGVPVLGGEFVVNLDDANDVLSVLGEASPITRVSTKPSVSAAVARRTAIASVARDVQVEPSALTAEPARLMLYDPRLLSAPGPYQSARLAWVTEVRGTSPATDIGQKVIVDATSGSVALSFETIEHAKNRSVCDANNATAQLPCVAPVWTEGSTPGGVDADVPPAYDYSGDTYDFFFTRFGRDSLDGAGLALVSTVDYCDPAQACPYQNAFWNGSQMVYGDGFAAADDVVGHELSHGFTDFSSSLFYYMQSGAINESMSDVFGEYIDQTNGAGTDTPAVKWLLGEDIPGIGAIRNMADPPAFNDPDRMQSSLFTADPGEGDGGGVHTNSGVNNKAAFLMADGGTFNGQTITGLGITKAARIYYTVNNSMLVSGSDYADLANALRQGCTNLVGTDGITAGDCVEVGKVALATEMDLNPTTAPTSTAAVCPSGLAVASTVLADDLETNTGQFTTGVTAGANSWSYPQNPNVLSGFDATYATSGVTNAWGYDRSTVSDSFLRMTNAVTLPANAYLHFNHAFGFEDDTLGSYDGGVLEYSTAGSAGPWTDAGSLFSGPDGANGYTGTVATGFSNPLAGRSAFVRESNGYGSSRASLTSLSGQNVMFRWRIGSDTTADDYGWFLDDIRIVTCAAPDATPPDTTIDSGPAAGSTITDATPTFGFSSTEVGSTFECRVDADAFAACTSPFTTGSLVDGAHTFEVRATDGAGNTDPSPASRSFTVDATPPDTTITSGPAAGSTINDATPTFGFSSTEGGSTFECRVDADAFAACTSPFTTGSLADGAHTFEVRATDGAGNTDPSPASRAFTVDATPPDTTITSGPAAGSTINDATPTFGFSSTEVGSTFECRVDADAFAACTSPFTTGSLADGAHTFEVRATDGAGNTDPSPASRTFTVDTTAPPDTTPPDTTITSGPAAGSTINDATPTFGFSSTEVGSTFECRVDADAFAACTSPFTTGSLVDGAHTFEVRATDGAGNTDPSPASRSFTVDTTPPDTTITSGPAAGSTINDATPTFGFTSTEAGSTFQCRVDAGGFAACTSPFTTGSLADGAHTFEVRATDGAGNTDPSPAARSFTVDTTPPPDTTPPDTTITSGPAAGSTTNDSTPTFGFTASEGGSTFECRVDAGGFAACTSPFTTGSLADGAHTFEVRATDGAGNTDPSPASRTFTVDTTPPDTTISSGPAAGSTINDATPTFGFTSTEVGSTFQCRVDAGGFAACTSPFTTGSLADGAHTFEVRATDGAGNTDPSPASRTFTVDTTPPDTTISSGPAAGSTINDATPTFGFTSTEVGSTFQCRLDADAFAACTSPFTTGSLADGAHTFEVRATDGAGNTDPSPAARSFTVDTTPPETTITGHPHKKTRKHRATFVFVSSEPGSTFMCKLDRDRWRTCASPRTYRHLEVGRHALRVFAIDAVGNAEPTWATWEWRIRR